MRLIYKEHSHSYKTYAFGYSVYGVFENGDILDEVYERGFLPFSGSPTIHDTFYMARSARIDLNGFSVSSENRRILKKFEQTSFERAVISVEDFINNEQAIDLCLNYFKLRHGEGIFSRERLMLVVHFSPCIEIIEYKQYGVAVAYVIGIRGKHFFHFWFSFFAPDYFNTSFGVFLMLDTLIIEKDTQNDFVYLGTVYGDKALYKTNFAPLSFWNGVDWSNDIKELKNLARTDTDREVHRIGL